MRKRRKDERHRGTVNLAVPVLGAALAALIITILFVAGGAVSVQSDIPKSCRKDAAPRRSPINAEARDHYAIEYWQNRVVEMQQQRQRQAMVDRLNAFLAGSPMAGLGECMLVNAERTGVWVSLCPAQAYAESSIGRFNCGPFNAWGMMGCAFSSWEQGVQRYFDNIVAHWGAVQNAHQLVNPDYCEPPEPYNSNVQHLAESI